MPDSLRRPQVLAGLGFLAFAFLSGRLDLPVWGYGLVFLVSLGAGIVVLLGAPPRPLVLWLGLLVGLTVALPQALGLFRGMPVNAGQVVFGIVIAVTAWVAAALPPTLVRWSALTALLAVTWAGLAAGVAALLGVFGYALYEVPGHDRDFFGIGQLRGVMPHPNTMGLFAALALVLGLRQVLSDWRGNRRRAAGVMLVLVLPAAVALSWSQSRTSAIAAVGGLLVVLLPLGKPRLRPLVWVIACLAALSVAAPLLVAYFTGYDFNGRGLAWQYAAQEFNRSPVLGFGSDFFSPSYWASYQGLFWYPDSAHNLLMQAAGQAGLLGLASLLAALAVMGVIAVRSVGFDARWGLVVFVVTCLLGGQEATFSIPVRSGVILSVAILASSAVLQARGAGVEGERSSTDRIEG